MTELEDRRYPHGIDIRPGAYKVQVRDSYSTPTAHHNITEFVVLEAAHRSETLVGTPCFTLETEKVPRPVGIYFLNVYEKPTGPGSRATNLWYSWVPAGDKS